MRPPSKVQVGPLSYDVVLVATDHPAVSDCAGRTERGAQNIWIDRQTGPDQLRETVLHEVLHTVWGLAGLQMDIDDVGEDSQGEKIINRVTPLLLDVLRRNPRLVAYLTEK